MILSAIFENWKHIQRFCERFHKFFPNFHRFFPDFKWFYPDFHQNKSFGDEVAPPAPPPPTPVMPSLALGWIKWFCCLSQANALASPALRKTQFQLAVPGRLCLIYRATTFPVLYYSDTGAANAQLTAPDFCHLQCFPYKTKHHVVYSALCRKACEERTHCQLFLLTPI